VHVINQRYEFRPPNGDPGAPIEIIGLQEYSPGQTKACDLWRLHVPPKYINQVQDQSECATYGGVTRLLANAFFGGDESRVAEFILEKV
jgi:hypothetical protein